MIDILVQSHRDAKAADRFFRKILKAQIALPRRLVTDRLGSYRVAIRKLMLGVEHIRSKGANNRAENSHQATRHREHRRYRFRSAGSAQRFLSSFSLIKNHFSNYRHTLTAPNHRLVIRSDSLNDIKFAGAFSDVNERSFVIASWNLCWQCIVIALELLPPLLS